MTGGKLRAGTIHKAINPDTGRVISTKTAKTMAWTALSRYVRKLEPICVTCGGYTSDAGHYIHNSDKPNKQLGGNALWYDIRNIHGQCSKCNRHYSGRLDVYAEYLEDLYGFGIIQELRELYQTPRKWTIQEFLAVRDIYEHKLENELCGG